MVKTSERKRENERGETKTGKRKRGKQTLKRKTGRRKRMSGCMETQKKGNKDSSHHMKQPHGGFRTV